MNTTKMSLASNFEARKKRALSMKGLNMNLTHVVKFRATKHQKRRIEKASKSMRVDTAQLLRLSVDGTAEALSVASHIYKHPRKTKLSKLYWVKARVTEEQYDNILYATRNVNKTVSDVVRYSLFKAIKGVK